MYFPSKNNTIPNTIKPQMILIQFFMKSRSLLIFISKLSLSLSDKNVELIHPNSLS
ncbi:MAG: Hypothetical protein AJITA_00727 [Acetilactobacillus jinshanensis]